MELSFHKGLCTIIIHLMDSYLLHFDEESGGMEEFEEVKFGETGSMALILS